jgi:phosphatidylserine decarboxylase
MATTLKMDNLFFSVTKQFCETHYSTALTSDAQKKEAIYDAFIAKYQIDMSQFVISDYTQFPTVNDWFIRRIKPELRPIAGPNDPTVIVSPADARVNVFTVYADSKIWLKTEKFSIAELLKTDARPYDGGSMAIVRLAPQDYHRFHMPISGTLRRATTITGDYHSVGVDGMRSDNGAIYNQRMVLIFDADDARIGEMAYVAVGATCVGSVVITNSTATGEPALGVHYNKGDELGYFQFGGSTVVIVFRPNVVSWSDDLAQHSRKAVESLINMGTTIARLR